MIRAGSSTNEKQPCVRVPETTLGHRGPGRTPRAWHTVGLVAVISHREQTQQRAKVQGAKSERNQTKFQGLLPMESHSPAATSVRSCHQETHLRLRPRTFTETPFDWHLPKSRPPKEEQVVNRNPWFVVWTLRAPLLTQGMVPVASHGPTLPSGLGVRGPLPVQPGLPEERRSSVPPFACLPSPPVSQRGRLTACVLLPESIMARPPWQPALATQGPVLCLSLLCSF